MMVKVMSLIPDEEYIQLYELFKSLLVSDSVDTKKVVVCYSELFIDIAKEMNMLTAFMISCRRLSMI